MNAELPEFENRTVFSEGVPIFEDFWSDEMVVLTNIIANYTTNTLSDVKSMESNVTINPTLQIPELSYDLKAKIIIRLENKINILSRKFENLSNQIKVLERNYDYIYRQWKKTFQEDEKISLQTVMDNIWEKIFKFRKLQLDLSIEINLVRKLLGLFTS
jgi:hypothetical protein